MHCIHTHTHKTVRFPRPRKTHLLKEVLFNSFYDISYECCVGCRLCTSLFHFALNIVSNSVALLDFNDNIQWNLNKLLRVYVCAFSLPFQFNLIHAIHFLRFHLYLALRKPHDMTAIFDIFTISTMVTRSQFKVIPNKYHFPNWPQFDSIEDEQVQRRRRQWVGGDFLPKTK